MDVVQGTMSYPYAVLNKGWVFKMLHGFNVVCFLFYLLFLLI